MDLIVTRMTEAVKPMEGFAGQGLLSLSGNKKMADADKVKMLAKEFESVFLNQVLKTMRSTVGESGLIKKGPGEELFTSMLDEETSRNMAFTPGGGMGLADQLTAQLVGRTITGADPK
ncbi:MAG: rod-binding protein [Nitrospinae bacterium]|nr:rod-binding protein [Nitrospinota bacterium]